MLFKKMNKSVFALAISLLGNKSLAEDVVQETFIRILTKSETYADGTNGIAWILQITRNLCLNLLKKKKYEVNIFEDIQIEEFSHINNQISEGKINEFDIALERFLLKEALLKLNENERQILILYAVSGLKHHEIADILNIPRSTERWYYISALRKSKKFLSK